MKRLGTALGLIVLLFALIPAALPAGGVAWTAGDLGRTELSSSCAQFCRDVCIAFGEPCCIVGPNTCGCC